MLEVFHNKLKKTKKTKVVKGLRTVVLLDNEGPQITKIMFIDDDLKITSPTKNGFLFVQTTKLSLLPTIFLISV